METINEVRLSVTGEERSDEVLDVRVVLESHGSDTEDWAYMVTTYIDGEVITDEGFDSLSEAKSHLREVASDYRSQDRENRKAHREAAADVMTEAAQQLDSGTDERYICKKLAKLFKSGDAAKVLAALQAAGL